jgi:hypothetical protein
VPEKSFLKQVTVLGKKKFPTLENQDHTEQKVAIGKQRSTVDADDNHPRYHDQDEVLVQPFGPIVDKSVLADHDRQFFLDFFRSFIAVPHHFCIL